MAIKNMELNIKQGHKDNKHRRQEDELMNIKSSAQKLNMDSLMD